MKFVDYIKDALTESAVQQGFVYEGNVTKFLTSHGYSDGVIAGASSDKPDVMLISNGKKAGCELKITNASGGSLVLHAYKSGQPWRFGDVKPSDIEKLELLKLAEKANILSEVNKRWTGKVYNVKDRDSKWEEYMLETPLIERYNADMKACPDIRIDLPSNAMSVYYNTKNTYYVNVGTHGFYLLGNGDPLKLNDNLRKKGLKPIPKFEDHVKITARIRCQSKGTTKAAAQEQTTGKIGGQGYQFTFEMSFSLPKNTSPYNIAPIAGKSVVVDENKATLDMF